MFEAGSLIYRIQTVGAGLFKSELDQADKAAKQAGKSVSEAARSTRDLGDQSRHMRPHLHQVTGELKNMSSEAQAASREVGGTLVAIGAGIVAIAGLTVKAAKDWETAWIGVEKVIDGTPEQIAAVESELRALTGILPASHKEIAAVAEAAGRLGIEAGSIAGFTKVMIDLGEATNITAEAAATDLARFMNVMGDSVDTVSNLGSAIVDLGNNFATSESEIVAMAMRLSGAGRQVGLTSAEVLGLATSLSAVGIEAQAGGSAISKVMMEIASQVENGGDKLDTFARIAGMSADQFSHQWRTNPGLALAAFVKGLADAEMQGESTLGMLEELGISEIRMRDALLRSAAAADGFADAMSLGNEAYAENIALATEAEKRYASFDSQVGMMRNKVTDLAIDLGQHLLPILLSVVQGIGDFADMLAGLPEPMQGAIAIGGALIGMITLAGGTALIAIPKIVAFRTAVATLTTTMPLATGAVRGFASFLGGPWGVAIAAGVTGIMLLTNYLKSAQSSAEEVDNAFRTASESGQLFETLGEGKEITYWRDVTADLENMNYMLQRVEQENANVFLRFSTETHGFRGALREAGEQLSTMAASDLPSATRAFSTFIEGQQLTREQVASLINEMPAFRDELTRQATALGISLSGLTDQEQALIRAEIALGEYGDATADATGDTKSAAAAYLEAADATTQLNRDLESLLKTLDEANRTNQDAITSNLDYKDTLADVDEAIKNARDGVEGYSLGLDENTQAGRDNTRMLVDIARDGWDAAEAQFALDGSVEGFRKRLVQSRDDLIQRAIDLGATRKEAEELADRFLKMPTDHEFEVIAETERAKRAVNGFITMFDGRRIRVSVDTYGGQTYRIEGQRVGFQADGSVRKAADGFVEPMSHQQAQMRRAGSYVLWAEDETEGESFIPHAPSKRQRSEQLLAETAALFGGMYVPPGASVRPMADGALSTLAPGQPATELREGKSVTVHISADDPASVGKVVIQTLDAYLMGRPE